MLSYRTYIVSFFLFVFMNAYSQNTRQHTVMRGETFISIANKYGIREQELKKANPGRTTCYAGLKLTIPAKESIRDKKVSQIPTLSKSKNKQKKEVSKSIGKDSKVKKNYVKNNKEKISNKRTKTPEQLAKKEKRKKFWKKVGSVAAVTGAVVVALAKGLTELDNLQRNGGETVSSGNIPNSVQDDPEEMLLISTLISKHEAEISNIENEIEKSDSKAKKQHNQNTTMVNIGGKLVKAPSKTALRTARYNGNGIMDKTEKAAWQSVIKDRRNLIQWLRGRQMRGDKYISKADYNNYFKVTKREREVNHELKKANQKAMVKPSMYNAYHSYVKQLQDIYYSSNSYEMSEVRNRQSKMRDLRNKHNLTKSPWEDWDGIRGTME